MYVKKRQLEGKKKMDVKTCLVHCASIRAQTEPAHAFIDTHKWSC